MPRGRKKRGSFRKIIQEAGLGHRLPTSTRIVNTGKGIHCPGGFSLARAGGIGMERGIGAVGIRAWLTRGFRGWSILQPKVGVEVLGCVGRKTSFLRLFRAVLTEHFFSRVFFFVKKNSKKIQNMEINRGQNIRNADSNPIFGKNWN